MDSPCWNHPPSDVEQASRHAPLQISTWILTHTEQVCQHELDEEPPPQPQAGYSVPVIVQGVEILDLLKKDTMNKA